ncbi:MAG: tetratricopeptide repeat protein [Clostridia bacterium]|nr:tetratricopeptide repeat protein [Clostridia bacterium]
MDNGKVKQIDFSRKRLGMLADKFYNEGKFLSALRIAYKELDAYGGDGEIFARLSDIYEMMNLQGTALNWWFRFLDIAEEEDLLEIYEGLAVNYLNLGQESASAYYYNKLIDVDDTLSEETKFDIAEAFSTAKKEKFRFVYPPKLADYTKEVNLGSKALKLGDCERAVEEFSKVARGSKQYAQAKEMQAIAYLLSGNPEEAEKACLDLLADEPDQIRVLATLAAVYLEQGRTEESKALALRLVDIESNDTDDLYKVATVCCENGLHEQAYRKFCILDEKIPFDGRMLYFKGVSAYKSGHIDEAEAALEALCTVYPDAEVAKYYLKAIRFYKEEGGEKPELIYFYHLPQEEREQRCRSLINIGKSPKDEAQIFGLLALHDGYFQWCFDEMDGGDHELQYLGLVTAVHVRADEFIQEKLLDYEVADVLKIETLRMLLERNEESEIGMVLCNIYRRLYLPRIAIGRKRRKRFVEGFAKVASKFIVIRDSYAEKIQQAAENLYRALDSTESLDLVDSTDDLACAIFLLSGLKELGNNPEMIAGAFDANADRVKVLLSAAVSMEFGVGQEKEKQNEID